LVEERVSKLKSARSGWPHLRKGTAAAAGNVFYISKKRGTNRLWGDKIRLAAYCATPSEIALRTRTGAIRWLWTFFAVCITFERNKPEPDEDLQ
jgi:hypothetical protein